MALPNEPITRQEMYLSNIAGQNTALPDAPITREEMYLDYIAKNGGTGEGDMKKSVYDSDNSIASAGGIKMFVNQKIGTLPQRVGSLETTAGVLEGEVASIEDTLDNLGTASHKNAISVVTDSSDLVESSAVKDIVGWGNANILNADVLFASSSHQGIKLRVSNQIISLNGTVSDANGYYFGNVNKKITLPAETYTFSIVGNGNFGTVSEIRVRKTDDSKIVGIYTNNIAPVTFTLATDTEVYFAIVNPDATIGTTVSATIKIQLEKGSTATSYEPYHASVEDSLAEKCDNSVIGTVEGENASKAWSVGEHFIKDGAFKEVTQPIASGGAINDSNTVDRPIADCLLRLLPIFNNAGSHNGIFRGKNLGSSLTTAQKTAIANGSFEDLYIGDYWEINGVKYRIAHFDYWLNSGDTQCTTHHVVIVPDSVFNFKNMNDKVNNADVTTGAYINSKMYTMNIEDARTIVKNAFGENNILTHREWFANATDANGFESDGSWYDSQIDLMNEIMVYGSNIFHNCINGTSWPGGNYIIDKVQLALFRLDQSYTIALNPAGTDRTAWWLRDVCNATYFARVAGTGAAYDGGASNSSGVRPAFGIK